MVLDDGPTRTNVSQDERLGQAGDLGERLAWQSALFAYTPSRAALTQLHATWPLQMRRIRFHRNHAVESALTSARPYLEFAGIAPEFLVGDYDDSLAFVEAGDAAVEVVWLDFARLTDRLSGAAIGSWLGERLAALRKATTAPILVIDWDGPEDQRTAFSETLDQAVTGISGLRVGRREALMEQFGEAYFDEARAAFAGTRISGAASVATGRLLGAHWLPALLEPRIKGVVLDLDNTLYDGVLGEDGADGVTLTDGHRALQAALVKLNEAGVFLALLSRNEASDVESLFRARSDFPLRWEHFSARSISWGAKSDGILQISDELRVATDALLFVDDNPGELLELLLRLPHLNCLAAAHDGGETARALEYFPKLWAFTTSDEDLLRVKDLRANEERDAALRDADADLAEYYRSLGVRVSIARDPEDQIERVAEMARKTNQFNLAMRRYAEPELRAVFSSDAGHVSTARLEDRLSDSGVIAMAITETSEDRLIVHELCMSCRAMGRKLESLIVSQMLVNIAGFDRASEVVFEVREGPRNGPARDWLAELSGDPISAMADPTEVTVPAETIRAASINPDVVIEVL